MLQLCRYQQGRDAPRLGLLDGGRVRDLAASGDDALADVDDALSLPLADLRTRVVAAAGRALPSAALGPEARLLAPIQGQEIWAAGVTYLRSRQARMEETSEKSVYERVYDAERPEIFPKGGPSRAVGPDEPIRIRRDSDWNVPEGEVTVVINRHLEIVGYTVGNDVSSRSIEGENPLYLPQAKVWLGSSALGPAITPVWEREEGRPFGITVRIRRGDQDVFGGETSTAQMARSFPHLVEYMGRDNVFPQGAFLMTGTGIVPPAEFTLQPGDVVEITVEDVGTLRNPVVQGDGRYALAP
jgi:2-dehydro-3-deoxy-D-arabinonate dehydratase